MGADGHVNYCRCRPDRIYFVFIRSLSSRTIGSCAHASGRETDGRSSLVTNRSFNTRLVFVSPSGEPKVIHKDATRSGRPGDTGRHKAECPSPLIDVQYSSIGRSWKTIFDQAHRTLPTNPEFSGGYGIGMNTPVSPTGMPVRPHWTSFEIPNTQFIGQAHAQKNVRSLFFVNGRNRNYGLA